MRHVACPKACQLLLRIGVSLHSTSHRLRVRSPFGLRNRPQLWHRSTSNRQTRGTKSRATVKLKDLPQGILDSGNTVRDWEDDGPAYPTVVQQARNNMRKFTDCVLLTRVGGFYEVCLHLYAITSAITLLIYI